MEREVSWGVALLTLGVLCGCPAAPEVPGPLTSTRTSPRTSPSGEPDSFFIESTAVTRSSGPVSITRDVLEDRTGRLWLASWEGIISFDGETFTNHTNLAGLRQYRAFTILEDRTGNLWFGTVGAGVYRYDGATFTRQLLSCEARMGRNPVCDGSKVSCRGHRGGR